MKTPMVFTSIGSIDGHRRFYIATDDAAPSRLECECGWSTRFVDLANARRQLDAHLDLARLGVR